MLTFHAVAIAYIQRMKNWIISLLLMPVMGFSQTVKTYKNLVLEGGGVRGIAYAGAFNELEKNDIIQSLDKVAGTSVGAIAGLMLSVGYRASEIDSIMNSLAIEEFNDGRGGLLGKYRRVTKKYGLYRGNKFEFWLKDLVRTKTGDENLTFSQLHDLHLKNNLYKDLYCTATNISKQQLDIFSFETAPEMPIALAVQISACIPLYFEPIVLDSHFSPIQDTDRTSPRNYYVDGGMLANYPIGIFDSCESKGNLLQCDKIWFNPQTLGIKLERPAQIDSLKNNISSIPPFEIRSFKEYIHAFNNLIMETLNRNKYPNLENEKDRTIYVSYGTIRAKVRKMKPAEKEFLYNNGAKAVSEFLLVK